ncbi:MAG TPA: cytochrome c family protein [Rhizomicrobium sp.]|nr:cytochrome c family protein [Rhizomicrobium sp.]
MVRALGIAVAIVALGSTAALAAGDAAKGVTIFNRCAICHSNTKGAPNKIGPNLFGVVGRKAGTAPGFSYTGAMKNSGITWTEDKLEAYVQHPALVVPGNKMAFAGLSSPAQADDLVAYLATLK